MRSQLSHIARAGAASAAEASDAIRTVADMSTGIAERASQPSCAPGQRSSTSTGATRVEADVSQVEAFALESAASSEQVSALTQETSASGGRRNGRGARDDRQVPRRAGLPVPGRAGRVTA